MYLYFGKDRRLKEIINDKAIISDSLNVNKIYVMFEEDQENEFDTCWIRYKKQDKTSYPGVSTYAIFDTIIREGYIPISEDRDLKYFQYGKPYTFRVFNIPSEVLENDTDNPLSVLTSIWYVNEEDDPDDNELVAMERFVFAVAPSVGGVTREQNINLAQWSQLLLLLEDSNVSHLSQRLDEEIARSTSEDNTLNNSVSTLNGSVSTLNNNVNSLDGRVDTLENTVSTLNNNVNSLDGRVDTLENTVSHIASFEAIVSTTLENTPYGIPNYYGELGGDEGTLAASSDTIGKIYLVKDTDTASSPNIYSEYLTTKIENVYSWEKIGSTQISVSGYAKLLTQTSSIPQWASDNTYASQGYIYKGTITFSGVTSDMFADVVFAPEQAISGDYAPICETGNNVVFVYSKVNNVILIPTIKVVYNE